MLNSNNYIKYLTVVLVGFGSLKVFANPSLVLEPVRQAAEEACSESRCFFIRQGIVYERQPESNVGRALPQSGNVRSVITYKHNLYAMQEDGNLYFWQDQDRMWIKIGNNIDKLQTDDKYLYVINKKGELGYSRGSSFTYTMVDFEGLRFGEASNFFYMPGIGDVKTLKKSYAGDPYVEHRDGSVESLFGSNGGSYITTESSSSQK
jgi:hypothetical protein